MKSKKLKKNKKLKKLKKNKDPMLKEFRFCFKCEPHVLTLVEHVRQQENTLIVAGDALRAVKTLNLKLSKEKELLEKKCIELRERLQSKAETTIQDKMDMITNAHLKQINRSNLC